MEPITPIIELKELAGNPLPQLNLLQQYMYPYTEFFVSFWISAWILTAIILIVVYVRAWKDSRA